MGSDASPSQAGVERREQLHQKEGIHRDDGEAPANLDSRFDGI
jgi:hypothetical protein